MMRRFVVTASLARTPSEGLSLALVLLCVQRDVASSTAGLLVAATSLPQLISGPALGPLLDRSPDVWRWVRWAAMATALAIVALATGVGPAPIGLAFVAAVIVAIAEPAFTGGISAAADRTVVEGDRVHAWDSFAYNVAGLLAPALVTVIAATAGPASATIALGGTVVAGGIVSIGLRSPPSIAQQLVDHQHVDQQHIDNGRRAGIWTAARAIVASAPLRAVTVSTTVAFMAFGGLTFAAVAAARAAGRSPNDAGHLFTALAVGGLIGSLVMTRRPAPVRPEHTVATSLAAMGAILLAMAATDTWIVVLAGAFVFGLIDGPLLVGVFAARTRHAPNELRTTVFTLGASAKLGASATGAVVAGQLLGDDATSAGLAIIGAVHLGAAALCRALGVAR